MYKEFNERWIELLIQGQENNKREFLEVLAGSKGKVFAIMKFRRMLMDKGAGQNVTIEQLENTEGADLIESLEELFLEPLTIKHLQFAKESNVTAREVLDRHMQDRNLRFLSAIKSI